MELKANIPAYLQIKEYYEKLIELGAIKEGEYLPSVRDVSLQIGVNPNTVQRAFTLLIDAGYISPIIGKGNRVNSIDKKEEKTELKKLITDIENMGYSLDEIIETTNEIIKEKGAKEK